MGKLWRRRIGLGLTYLTLATLSVIFLIPLLWLFTSSLMPLSQIGKWPPQWIPNPVQWGNYTKALKFWHFGRSFRNTTIITVFSMIGELTSCTLVAYGFARLRFPGRDTLFIVLLSTMMLPFAVRMVPMYIGFSKLGWINTFLPLIVPTFFGNPFYVFLLRQFFLTIPDELVDAARIDGASEFNIWARIILPLSGPAIIVVAIFSFQAAWNDFIGPLLYLNDERLHTLALGLYTFTAMPGQGSLYNQLMAASVLMVLPMLIVFAIFQRYFVQGVTLSGLKG
ncbi:MAG: carbohydrate ABC transporter permease [Anaerolineae bacterium]|nr:carbohydrate ABC transporter permease [Anaerolineae bacterium]